MRPKAEFNPIHIQEQLFRDWNKYIKKEVCKKAKNNEIYSGYEEDLTSIVQFEFIRRYTKELEAKIAPTTAIRIIIRSKFKDFFRTFIVPKGYRQEMKKIDINKFPKFNGVDNFSNILDKSDSGYKNIDTKDELESIYKKLELDKREKRVLYDFIVNEIPHRKIGNNVYRIINNIRNRAKRIAS